MRSDRGVGAVAVVGAVLVLAVAGAAVGGPWRLQSRSLLRPSSDGEPLALPTPPEPSGMFTPPPRGDRQAMDLSWLLPLAVVLAAVAVVALSWWLFRRYQQTAQERRRARDVRGSLVLPTTPEVPILRQGVEAAQRSLDEIADPNNAVVAAWLALEDAAASSGVPRRPAETPTEFTVDVLRSTRADQAATRELLGLYHRARFSAAGVSRTDVNAASRCLAALARSWEAMSAEAVSAAVDAADRGPSAAGSDSR